MNKIPAICGSHWDLGDAQAAYSRVRAVSEIALNQGAPCPVDEAIFQLIVSNSFDKDRLETSRHSDHPSGPYLLVTRAYSKKSDRHAIAYRLCNHRLVKDFTLLFRYDLDRDPNPDLGAIADFASGMLGQYLVDFKGQGRCCRNETIKSINEASSAFSRIIHQRWSSQHKLKMMMANLTCPTPWARASATIKNGSESVSLLHSHGEKILSDALPQAYTVDWTDEVQKGTGIRTSLMTIAPFERLTIVKADNEQNPVSDLRAHALLPFQPQSFVSL